MLSNGKLAVLLATALAIGQAAMSGAASGATASSLNGAPSSVTRLDIYYTPPVLVRAGEPVRFPVDVVCATPKGRACPATLTVGAAPGPGPWRVASAAVSPSERVDLTGQAERAIASGARTGSAGTGVVRFFLRAEAGGRTAALGSQSATGAIRFYVTGDMRSVDVPSIPFGDVRSGATVLSLPWGSGPFRAGLALGNQSPTVGPSAFDVDASGRVYLLDELQGRVAVFDGGRLVRRASVAAQPPADIAVGRDGTAWILSRDGRTPRLVVREADAAGRVGPSIDLGDGVPGQIRTAGATAFVHTYPLDAWVSVGSTAASAALPPLTGEPAADGSQTLSVATGNAMRLGTVVGHGVRDAVELRFHQKVGEIALAEPDGHGGYWVVQRVWRQGSRPADQYQFVHVAGDHVAGSFAIPDASFALSAALSKFRIGADGALYQLRTSSSGMRIVRYEIGGAA